MRTSKDKSHVGEACLSLVERHRKAMNLPKEVAFLDGVAKRRFMTLLKDGDVYHAGNEKVVQHGEASLVCVVGGEEVYPVAVNMAGKLEACVKAKGHGFKWSQRTQSRITRRCEQLLNDIEKVGGITCPR